ncbi:MAG: CpsD/CapB family tyrosine-protein kinase [Pontixanthobacter sp.]
MTEQTPTYAGSHIRLADLPTLTPDVAALRRNNIIGFNNRTAQSRPFDLLRTSFAKRLKDRKARLVGITSATPSAGKSFLSINLAASLARVADEEVHLVDLDIRRASVADGIGFEPEIGIESFLSGQETDLRKLGYRVENTKLGVFPTIRNMQNTAEMLSGASYPRLIDAFRNHARDATVLFDLPPAFASDDAMISVDQLDGYILVVDSGTTTKKQINEVVALLDPAPCLGTILNRYRGGLGDTYGYGYNRSQYARYYNDDRS